MTLFECYADETLLRVLGAQPRELKFGHSFGRSRVSARLAKSRNSTGLIDEDPNAPQDHYLQSIFRRQPIFADRYIISHHDPELDNRLIVLRPNLESWACRLAIDSKIRLDSSKYRLSDEPERLHDLISPRGNDSKRTKFAEFLTDVSTHHSIINLRKFFS